MECDPNVSSEELEHNVRQASELFDRHGEFIRSVAGFALSDQSVVEDFCHDLFMYFAAKPVDLDNEKVRGLLYQIIKCRAKNFCQRATSYKQRIQRYCDIKRQEKTEKPTESIADFHDLTEVYEAINTHLSEVEATAILLRYRDQRSTRETAELMGVKIESVRRYVSVGLKKVRSHLKKKKEVEP